MDYLQHKQKETWIPTGVLSTFFIIYKSLTFCKTSEGVSPFWEASHIICILITTHIDNSAGKAIMTTNESKWRDK